VVAACELACRIPHPPTTEGKRPAVRQFGVLCE
jgi:hypothetical protein